MANAFPQNTQTFPPDIQAEINQIQQLRANAPQNPDIGAFGIRNMAQQNALDNYYQQHPEAGQVYSDLDRRGYISHPSNNFLDKGQSYLPYAGMAALTLGSGALAGMGGAGAGAGDVSMGAAGTGVNTSGSIAGTALGEGAPADGVFGGSMPTAMSTPTGAIAGDSAIMG